MNWAETPAELERARHECPTTFNGPRGALIGIFTPPAPDVPRADRCVVILSRPRAEQRRLSVQIARSLAADGFACFRFDQHGWGDSDGELQPLILDRPATVELLAALEHLRDRFGQRRFIVYGACFDARNALSACVEAGASIVGVVFSSAPVTRFVTTDVFNWRNLASWAIQPARWRQLLLSPSTRQLAVRALRFTLRGTLGKMASRDASAVSITFQTHLEALIRSRARALVLYGEDDEEYQSFILAERAIFPRLKPDVRSRIDIEVWPGRVHSPYEIQRQQAVAAKIITWIRALHPHLVRDQNPSEQFARAS